MSPLGQTRLRRPPGRRAYSRPVLLSKRTFRCGRIGWPLCVLTPSIRAITRDVAGETYEVTEAKVDENGKPVLDNDSKPIFITVNRPTKVVSASRPFRRNF